MSTTFEQRLVSKYERGPGCWLWTGAKTRDGYGSIFQNGASQLAHRVVYEQLVGPIPEGMEVDHLCRVPACVNPAHLEPVTHQENGRRGIKGVLTTHCPQGHPYDEANTYRYRGHRQCRACNRAAVERYKARKRAEATRARSPVPGDPCPHCTDGNVTRRVHGQRILARCLHCDGTGRVITCNHPCCWSRDGETWDGCTYEGVGE